MVYPTNNEQGFDFRVCGATWEPIDYDGLKLMLRPHPGSVHVDVNKLKPGDSKAEKRLAAKRFAKSNKVSAMLPETYLVVDVETTGLSVDIDEIIEIGCAKVVNMEIADNYQAIVRTSKTVSPQIEALTGISNELISKEGKELNEIIREFSEFRIFGESFGDFQG